ncbi:MAG: RtcB family protein, partial [Bacteroidales bacterium]|nr:RtcB family protein [Bacteroidales bacterium]
MKKVISTERIPIKLWLDDIEEGALDQAKNIANLPFAFKHVAIMPDSHQGYGMPIGGVLATKGVIIPNAVGVDIGCGMCALKTSLSAISTKDLKNIMSRVRELIPLGFEHHKEKQDLSLMPSQENIVAGGVVERQFVAAQKQLGTLGGGNHFIEIQKGSDGHIWIMIHSGSRNICLKVADHYNNLAKKLN